MLLQMAPTDVSNPVCVAGPECLSFVCLAVSTIVGSKGLFEKNIVLAVAGNKPSVAEE